MVTNSTKKNLEMRVEAENGATAGKTDLAKRAKALNLDAIHDTVHEMARDEARHGKAFAGLLKPLLRQIRSGFYRIAEERTGRPVLSFLIAGTLWGRGARKEDGTACTVLFS